MKRHTFISRTARYRITLMLRHRRTTVQFKNHVFTTGSEDLGAALRSAESFGASREFWRGRTKQDALLDTADVLKWLEEWLGDLVSFAGAARERVQRTTALILADAETPKRGKR